MSASLSMRPPTAKFTLAMSSSLSNEPETRSEIDSSSVSIRPAGRTAFWAWSAASSAPRSIPSSASSVIENSMKTCSSWTPSNSIFDTSGTFSSLERSDST
jgi:hypothetical protein